MIVVRTACVTSLGARFLGHVIVLITAALPVELPWFIKLRVCLFRSLVPRRSLGLFNPICSVENSKIRKSKVGKYSFAIAAFYTMKIANFSVSFSKNALSTFLFW